MSHISLLLNVDSFLCNMFHGKNEKWKAEKFKFEKGLYHRLKTLCF